MTASIPDRLPFRGTFGAHRPEQLRPLALPPAPMPSHDGGRPLKAWRYVGVFGPELMLCALVRSSYRQPFGAFSGELPGGLATLTEGLGVMERHEAWW
jgi:hypothetical protein